jgi:hypothetical protein
MSNINISVTEQDPINVSIASPEVQNVDVTGQSISASVPDGDKGDIIVSGNGTIWTLDPNALATRVPYTGATADVNLGEFGLLTGNIEFDTSPTNAPTGAGSMVWNDTEGTADLMLKGGNVNLPIGQKQVLRAVNGTGGNLTRAAYRAVKITGAQGQRLQVSLARADNDANSKDTIGLVAEDIGNNQEGFIVTSGTIANINTTGSLQGETWSDGDTLYLSGTTSGVITNVKPSAPTHTVILGFVIYAHQNNGKIYVKVDNGYELDELHNVNVSTAASGDYLRYNGTVWVDSTIGAADLPSSIDAAKIGAGLVSNTEFGYLDGVTSSIQTQLNGKQATLTNPVTGTGTTNYIAKFTGTSAVGNSLIYDNGTNVGIGNTNTTYTFDVTGSGRFSGTLYTRTGTNVAIEMASTSALRNLGTFYVDFASSVSGLYRIRGGTNLLDYLTIKDTGEVGISNTSPSYLLDVSGTLRNTTSAYFATSSGGVGIGITSIAPQAALEVKGQVWLSESTRVQYLSIVPTLTENTIYSNYTGGGSDKPIIIGTFANRTNQLYLATSGSVGIGTTSPIFTSFAQLTVSGTQGGIVIRASASGYSRLFFAKDDTSGVEGVIRYFHTDNSMQFFTNSSQRLVITSAGDFGVNNLTPSYKMDIIGTLRSTNDAYFATNTGNVGIGTVTLGTSANRVIGIINGTAPTTSPTDVVQIYANDITAGNAALHVRTEGGAVIKLYQETTAVGTATFVQNSVNAVYEDSTFDGYTLKQIVKALRNNGLLA